MRDTSASERLPLIVKRVARLTIRVPRSAWPLVGVTSAMTAVTSTRGRKDRGEIFGDQDQSHTFTFSAPQEAAEGAVGGGTTVAPIDDVRQEKRVTEGLQVPSPALSPFQIPPPPVAPA
ncbi:hypothetical protein B296_00037200 [Ensete ventricosum]|uniref:Uncharacterized protein n=1 Tax=Ensete ventricosum TaxID=4639 RepID=A0A426YEC5_ENSVE|nr:hypothetical protein B296_00037200 [Ensete ventricosum]